MTRTLLASLLTDEMFGNRWERGLQTSIKSRGSPELSKVSYIVRHGNCHTPLHESWGRLYEVVFGRYSTMVTRMQKRNKNTYAWVGTIAARDSEFVLTRRSTSFSAATSPSPYHSSSSSSSFSSSSPLLAVGFPASDAPTHASSVVLQKGLKQQFLLSTFHTLPVDPFRSIRINDVRQP